MITWKDETSHSTKSWLLDTIQFLKGIFVDKDELVEVLEYAHALWTQRLPSGTTFKEWARAWYDCLRDLDPDDVRAALVTLSGTREFLPRPAQIRREVIDANDPDPVPSGDEAFEIWVGINDALNHGTHQPQSLHPVIRDTIRTMRSGDTRDRRHFLAVYDAIRDRYDRDRYRIPPA